MRTTRLLFTALILTTVPSFLYAQSTSHRSTAAEIIYNDSLILADNILPLVKRASASGEMPDWQVLGQDISIKYGDGYVDRGVTRAKIYYYYGKDWALFSRALVHYTDAYEDKDNLDLMNRNAKMILQYSQSPDELKSALAWIKHAVDKMPGNTDYKSTYNDLLIKVKTAAVKS